MDTVGGETKKLPLPLSNQSRLLFEGDMFHGSFITTIPLSDGSVAKVMRLHRPEIDEIVPSPFMEKYLNRGTTGLIEMAKDRQNDYDRIAPYLNDFLPKLKGIAVVSSPAQILYRSRYSKLPMEIISKFPKEEKTIMEIWENAGAGKDLERLGREGFERLWRNPEFKNQLRSFARVALQLFTEKGIMLDIADRSGIRFYSEGGQRDELRRLEDVLTFIENPGGKLPYPRNVGWGEKGLRYTDIFPLGEVSQEFRQSGIVTRMRELIVEKDTDSLRGVIEEVEGFKSERRLEVIRYLALLSNMGADLKL